jgi:hypothetical protein
MPLHVLGVTRPSSGGCAQMLFGVITWVGCVLTECRLGFHTHPMHVITPNSICAEAPEDGRVTPETSKGIDS